MPFTFAVASNVWIAAARLPARSDPVNNQFFFLGKVLPKKNYVQFGIMWSWLQRIETSADLIKAATRAGDALAVR